MKLTRSPFILLPVWVYVHPSTSPTVLQVYLALVNRSRLERKPPKGITWLMEASGLGRSAVYGALATLREMRAVVDEDDDTLWLPADDPAAHASIVTDDPSAQVDDPSAVVDRASLPEKEERADASRDLDEAAFEEWWKAYPRKIGKPAARKAYIRALKKTTPTVLLEAAQRYATARAGEDATYTKHPGPWLNDERWNDDPAPIRGKRRPGNLDNFDNSQARRAQPGGEIKFKPGARSA